MPNVLFTNVRILDGSGEPACTGKVTVQLAGQGARRLSGT